MLCRAFQCWFIVRSVATTKAEIVGKLRKVLERAAEESLSQILATILTSVESLGFAFAESYAALSLPSVICLRRLIGWLLICEFCRGFFIPQPKFLCLNWSKNCAKQNWFIFLVTFLRPSLFCIQLFLTFWSFRLTFRIVQLEKALRWPNTDRV